MGNCNSAISRSSSPAPARVITTHRFSPTRSDNTRTRTRKSKAAQHHSHRPAQPPAAPLAPAPSQPQGHQAVRKGRKAHATGPINVITNTASNTLPPPSVHHVAIAAARGATAGQDGERTSHRQVVQRQPDQSGGGCQISPSTSRRACCRLRFARSSLMAILLDPFHGEDDLGLPQSPGDRFCRGGWIGSGEAKGDG